MAYELPLLPYDVDALQPFISSATMTLHYGKHHQGYADKLNKIIEGTKLTDESLEQIIEAAMRNSDQDLFNNAAQVWNHNFFWNSLLPKASEPSEELAAEIKKYFDGMDGFNKAFKAAATGEFGSGWAWLVATAEGLEVMSTSDADLPLAHGKAALIGCDVWEHAYYLDYQNDRGKFLDAFLGASINWEFASQNWKQFKGT